MKPYLQLKIKIYEVLTNVRHSLYFHYGCLCVWQQFLVSQSWRVGLTDRIVNLFANTLLYFWMPSQVKFLLKIIYMRTISGYLIKNSMAKAKVLLIVSAPAPNKSLIRSTS